MPIVNQSNTIFQRGAWPDLLFWLAYSALTQFFFAPAPFEPVNLMIMGAFLSAELIAVYCHLRFGLLPLLKRQRSVAGYLLITAAAVTVGLLAGWAAFYMIGLVEPALRPTVLPNQFFSTWGNKIGWSTGSVIALSSGLMLFTHRRRQAQRERELEMAKTQAELAYLRSQFNPHFLFNALNNIYVLIDRDPDLARDSLLGFSDLLRYQLYASEAAAVPLADEVDQLRKFAGICQLRMEKDFSFVLHTPENYPRAIPPMLLLPLMENAFKHSRGDRGFVTARLTTTQSTTSFTITNKIGQATRAHDREPAGGIGLANLRRRLNLLFADRYRLDVFTDGDQFTASLELPHG